MNRISITFGALAVSAITDIIIGDKQLNLIDLAIFFVIISVSNWFFSDKPL